MMGPNGQNTFLLEKHPPIREHIAQIRVRRILHYFSNLVKYRASRKKVTIRMLLAPRCTGSIASSWHPESTFEIMGPLNTARAYLCNTSKGLYKLFYPAIPDENMELVGRTRSKLGEHGEHGEHGKDENINQMTLITLFWIQNTLNPLFVNQMTQNTLFESFFCDGRINHNINTP